MRSGCCEGRAYRYDGALSFRAPAATSSRTTRPAGRSVIPDGAIDDLVLLRSDGSATYNFATAVDDTLMEITHVISGEDHLDEHGPPARAARALGLRQPRYAHCALLLDETGAKLSKRSGAASIADLRGEGYPPRRSLNYFAQLACPALPRASTLLGRARVALRALVALARPERFDRGNLDYLSQQHLERLNALDLARASARCSSSAESCAIRPS